MSIRTAVIAGCAAGFCTLMAGTAAARTHNPEAPTSLMHQQLVSALFRAEGIAWISSGHCARRTNPRCTSFEGLRAATFSGLLALKEASHCHLTVSGGTEAGHAASRYSHHAGYKLDVLPNRCLDDFIPKHFRHVPTRGDGATQYRAPGPMMFARERSHWDITFGGATGPLTGRKNGRATTGRDKPMAGAGDDMPPVDIGAGSDPENTGAGTDHDDTGVASAPADTLMGG